MAEIFLQSQGKLLVLFHAVVATVLWGASTHHAIIAIGLVRARPKLRLARIYAATAAGAYFATVLLGALAYPSYRYYVRGLYLDRYAVWASNLFDIKENFAAVGLPLVIAAFLLSRVLTPKSERGLLVGYLVMVLLQAVIVWFSVLSGLLLTMVKGLP